jgi:hypothetical protein
VGRTGSGSFRTSGVVISGSTTEKGLYTNGIYIVRLGRKSYFVFKF